MLVTVDGKCTVVRYWWSRKADSGTDLTFVSLMSKISRLDRVLITKFQSLLVSIPTTFNVRMVRGVLPIAVIRSFSSPPLGFSTVIILGEKNNVFMVMLAVTLFKAKVLSATSAVTSTSLTTNVWTLESPLGTNSSVRFLPLSTINVEPSSKVSPL